MEQILQRMEIIEDIRQQSKVSQGEINIHAFVVRCKNKILDKYKYR